MKKVRRNFTVGLPSGSQDYSISIIGILIHLRIIKNTEELYIKNDLLKM